MGSLVSLVVTTLKSSVPFQFSVWGFRFGTKVVAVNFGLKIIYISLIVSALTLIR